MSPETTKIAVVGAGAIGGITAAFLAKAGWNVEIVCKHQETVDLACSTGLRITGIKGEHRVPVRAVKDITDLSEPKDLILLATKAAECVDAARQSLPFLKDDGALVSLQNGICEEALAEVVGRDRIVGCVVGWGATMHGPGDLEMTSGGEFVVGSIDAQPDPRLATVRQMLSEIVPARISDNMMGELYGKLIINSCINSLGAITGQTLGRLLASWKVRSIFTELMREAMAVAAAMKIKVAPGGGGKLDYYRFLEGDGVVPTLKRHAMIRIIGFKYRRLTSSSLQSLQRGRKTEVDYLNGFICDQGRKHGVPTPMNDTLVAIIKQIEDGDRTIGVHNMADPAFG